MEHVSSVRPTGKFPEKVENLRRWSRLPGWNFRTECRVPFTFLVVCTSSRSTVGQHQKTTGGLTLGNLDGDVFGATATSTRRDVMICAILRVLLLTTLPSCFNRRAPVGNVKLVCLALWREREYLTFISIRFVAFSNLNFADYRS